MLISLFYCNGDNELDKEEIRSIVQNEIWKVPILDFWMGIVFENLNNGDPWYHRLPHGAEFWHGMNYPEFFEKLPQHLGKENEPFWAMLKLNV